MATAMAMATVTVTAGGGGGGNTTLDVDLTSGDTAFGGDDSIEDGVPDPFLGVPFAGPPPCVRFPFLGTRSPADLAVAVQ